MAFQVRKSAAGLLNNANKFDVPGGAFAVGDNVIINADNEAERRFGFDACASGLPAALPEQLMVHDNTLFVHINNKLYYQSGNCVYTLVQGVSPLFGSAAPFRIGSKLWGNTTYLYVTDDDDVRRIEFATNNVTTIAGIASTPGSADGVGSAARFDEPQGIWGNATDIYICDFNNSTIRRLVIATNTVSTFAGLAGMAGSTDGVGAAARFNSPVAIWGNATDLYICDGANFTIRKIDIATATVTTFAGTALMSGSADGVGAAARFNYPGDIWGNATDLYVCDRTNSTIRRIDIATATVSTFAGTAGVLGTTDGVGNVARFRQPSGIWGNATYLYVFDFLNFTVRRIEIATATVMTYAGQPGVPGSTDGVILIDLQEPT